MPTRRSEAPRGYARREKAQCCSQQQTLCQPGPAQPSAFALDDDQGRRRSRNRTYATTPAGSDFAIGARGPGSSPFAPEPCPSVAVECGANFGLRLPVIDTAQVADLAK